MIMFTFSFRASLTIFLFFISFSFSQPSKTDYLIGYGGLTIATASELLKEHIGPDSASWVEPNSFDLFFRNSLKWEDKNLAYAELISDVIAKGIFVPSIFWTPLLNDYAYNAQLLLNIQVLAATGLMVNATKFLVSRQRPYSYFKTYPSQGRYDNLSFYSGHSAFSFALTTSSAYTLQKSYPHKSGFIWTAGILLSSVSAYLRIAADHHYMSDVMTGALVGSLTAYIISRQQSKRFFEEKTSSSYKTFHFSITF